MEDTVLFERDLLYPTGNNYEPGCIHLRMFKPDNSDNIPIIIESKTSHSPVDHIEAIIKIIQSDILDRIYIDIKNHVNLYIQNHGEAAGTFAEAKYIRVRFYNESINFEAANELGNY
jgi:hypothetical protein